MSRIAVDVVLLPPEAIMDRAIEANAELVEKFGGKIVLNKDNCLPHISLAMGSIDEGDIGKVEQLLGRIAGNTRLGDLAVVGITVSTNAVGEKVSCFEVARTEGLQSLHERVMEELAEYLSGEATAEMLHGSEGVAASTLIWIRGYREKSSFANFRPHITIGYGETEGAPFPLRFAVSRLALCHLGNHCTCRRILASVKIKRRQALKRRE